ncbi:MAG TPA: ClpXP protease specificity-enhancing factor [Methylibium sp.]|nr:ClpXP protease specificity-enhancing factor [Methylibium sp.]
MSMPLTPDGQGSSTRPYLIRALHDWCTDNGFTPYLAVYVDHTVQVPVEYVKNNEIVLNASFEATSGLQLGNDVIRFKARFGGAPRDIAVPVDHVIAIYARENGQGMAFPAPATAPAGTTPVADDEPRGLRLAPAVEPAEEGGDTPPDAPEPGHGGGGRPSLKRIK